MIYPNPMELKEKLWMYRWPASMDGDIKSV